MFDQKQFEFEKWYKEDPNAILRKNMVICGVSKTSVVINLEKMEICLESDPSNILYLARVKRGTEPKMENTD